MDVLDDDADDLAAVDGRLYLTGVDEKLADLLRRVGKLDLRDTIQIVPVSDVIGASTHDAVDAARRWLSGSEPRDATAQEEPG